MLVRIPDYFDQFACLAGDCPHSCCIGWEVVIGLPCSLTARTSAFRWTAAAVPF